MKSALKKLLRIHKYIASSGISSRRKAEELIEEGKVLLNGKILKEKGVKVDPSIDIVIVDGQVVDHTLSTPIYLALYKPRGVVSTLRDPEGRTTVADFVAEVGERIFPVGRLDYLSEGLLLMTNDGDFSQLISHPSFGISKVYEVKVSGRVTKEILLGLKKGLSLKGQWIKPEGVRVVSQLPRKTWLEFRLKEGKNREIRHLCESQGFLVDKLRRVAIGGLSLKGLGPGKYRFYSKKQLLRQVLPN